MKNKVSIITVSLLLALFVPHAGAEHGNAPTDEFAIELLYRHFESHYTPKDVLQKAQREAIHIAGEFKKGEAAGRKALDEFMLPFTRWNQMDGLQPFSIFFDVSNGSVVTHPNPALHLPLLNKENLFMRYKDHAGRLVGLEMLEKIKTNPEGAWIFQYTTWVKSKTKIASPLYSIDALVKVPGTPYFVSAVMPHRACSIEEMDKIIAYLDAMVEHWSIME